MDNHNITYLDSGTRHYRHRVLIGTATTGAVRMEWVATKLGQIIPTNWEQGTSFMHYGGNHIITNRFPVADAQNLIVGQLVREDFEWLFLHEHDVLLPPNGLIILNEYMRNADVPVVSGLYWTRSQPSEPIIYRGRGNSYYTDWEPGDKVWVDGVPTGCLLIHGSLLRAMWDESEEYIAYGHPTRRVFDSPAGMFLDPLSDNFATYHGTSDLEWCRRVMEEDWFTKAGWSDYAGKEFPFLLDTNLMCGHIDISGQQYPKAEPWKDLHKHLRAKEQAEPEPLPLGVSVADGVGVGDKVG